MKVFLTGGTGFVGSRVLRALVKDGHTVTALSRRTGTDLEKSNVKVVRGSLKDLDLIAAAAADADAVFHIGFEHDFTRYQECCEQDVAVVKAVVKALSGSGKLFVNTAGSASSDTGDTLVTEQMPATGPRAESEVITLKANEDGIRGVMMRMPPFVYSKGFSFFYDVMYKAAERTGSSSYVGAGDNKLCAVHVDDAASAYAALLTHKDARGAYNISGETGFTAKDIAETIAAKLKCRSKSVQLDEAKKLFGPVVAMRVSMNAQVDNSKARRELNWKPQHIIIKQEI